MSPAAAPLEGPAAPAVRPPQPAPPAPVVPPTSAGRARRVNRARRVRRVLLAVVLVVVAAVASVVVGARSVGLDDVLAGLGGATGTFGEAAVAARVPRTALALLVGASLGLSGAVMQAVTRNPLADPGILGVTAGAALAVVLGIAFFSLASPRSYVWVAILGAAAASAFVYAVGSIGRGGADPLRLALAGAATAAALSSLTSAVLLPRIEVINQFRFWQVGGVGGATPDRLSMVVPFVVVGAALCLASSRGLDALALGEDTAASLGRTVGTTRAVAALGAVVLCGAATAVAGPIAFVGLVVPHLGRLLVGQAHRWLLPVSVLLGAALLTLADVLGRVVLPPTEVDVGIVAALVGGPVFLVMVRRSRVGSR